MSSRSIITTNNNEFKVSFHDHSSYSKSVIPTIKRTAKKIAMRECNRQRKNLSYTIEYNLNNCKEIENQKNIVTVTILYKEVS